MVSPQDLYDRPPSLDFPSISSPSLTRPRFCVSHILGGINGKIVPLPYRNETPEFTVFGKRRGNFRLYSCSYLSLFFILYSVVEELVLLTRT